MPRFSETGEIVLVNLSTLESEVVVFSSGSINQKDETQSQTNEQNPLHDIEEL